MNRPSPSEQLYRAMQARRSEELRAIVVLAEDADEWTAMRRDAARRVLTERGESNSPTPARAAAVAAGEEEPSFCARFVLTRKGALRSPTPWEEGERVERSLTYRVLMGLFYVCIAVAAAAVGPGYLHTNEGDLAYVCAFLISLLGIGVIGAGYALFDALRQRLSPQVLLGACPGIRGEVVPGADQAVSNL